MFLRLLETSAFGDVSLKTLRVLIHRRIVPRMSRPRAWRIPTALLTSIVASCNSLASNRVWAAVLATTQVLRFVACTRTPSASKRDVPANCSRLQPDPVHLYAHLCYAIHTSTCLPDGIHQQVRHLSLLRRSRRLLS